MSPKTIDQKAQQKERDDNNQSGHKRLCEQMSGAHKIMNPKDSPLRPDSSKVEDLFDDDDDLIEEIIIKLLKKAGAKGLSERELFAYTRKIYSQIKTGEWDWLMNVEDLEKLR
jgi:hypothetical protein